jgi:all-trans-retinol 13,14-reductase
MHVGVSYKQHPPSGSWDAIVVGSGIGGLACAAALARYGKRRVLVLERHYRIGGYTHAFTRPGYEWDVGVHYLGDLGEHGVVRGMFNRLTDGSLRWAALPDVYDRMVLGERSYDYVTGARRFVSKMRSYFPSEGDAIQRYVTLIKEVARSGSLYYVDRALPRAVSRVAGPLLRRPYLKYATRTTLDVLRELTSNEELIAVLTGQFGDYGLPPSRSSFAMHASVAAHYLGGAWYPVGGAGAIAKAFAPVIEGAGGALVHSAEVAEVTVESGRAVGVRMTDGKTLRAELVVSDAGAASTFGRLVPESEREKGKTAALRGALGAVSPSVGYLCLYLGFEHTDAELGLTGTNLWLYPDAKHDENIARFLSDPSSPLPLVYASFPSAKDPSFQERYPGRATIDLITLCPWEWVAKWKDTSWMKRGAEYDALKASLTERLLDVLYKEKPQLRGKVAHAELSTPLTTRHFAGHPRGELYGLDHSPARYRVPLRAQTPIAGLYLTGADLVSAGVAGALVGGVMTSAAILGVRLLGDVMKRA